MIKKVFFFFFLFVIPLVCAEISVTVNLKDHINEISSRFISNEIDFYQLMKFEENVAVLSPSYLKLKNFLKFIHDSENHLKNSNIHAVFELLYRRKITPVIVLDYNVTDFQPITLLDDLRRAKKLNIRECIWQLGEAPMKELLDGKNSKKYADDLKTLKILCDSVRRDRRLDWNVAATSTLIESKSDDLVTFDVEGFDFGSYTPLEILSKPAIAASTEHAAWATVKAEYGAGAARQSRDFCNKKCLLNGLSHANALGELARKGYDVLFFDSLHSDGFVQAINKVHNTLVGRRVFNARVSKSQQQSSVHAYCAKKMNGGVTLMSINYLDTRAKMNVKLSGASVNSNTVVSQYLLSVANDRVLLNNERYNGTVMPTNRFKKTLLNTIDLQIPPFSVAFFVIKNAKVKACMADETNQIRRGSMATSSSDDLLKHLVASRLKRQINFPKIDFKLPSLVTPNTHYQRHIPDVFNGKSVDAYKVAPIDVNPLQSSENPMLPDGDVYLAINDGTINEYVDAEIQYPVEEKKKKKVNSNKTERKSKYFDMVRAASETPEFIVSHDYVENARIRQSSTAKNKLPAAASGPAEIGELFETEKSLDNGFLKDQVRDESGSKQVEIKTIMRELEPTYRQSKKALSAAKRKFDQNQLMKLLKDATLQEADREQIQNADELEVIDLSPNDDDEYEYDEDEDGFFSSGKKVRTRRSAVFNYRHNEIPRYGDHTFDDSDQDEDDDEDLVNDKNFFVSPQYDLQLTSTAKSNEIQTQKAVVVNEESPIVVRVVDAFSKSLDDVIYTVNKNIISWWQLFVTHQNFS